MKNIGFTAVFLFVAALASFVFGFVNPDRLQFAAGLGAVCFAVACLILAITIWRRSKTERI
jgi:4-amino-4-deoxy-L-arabinose transferase-like glycosyltransferase